MVMANVVGVSANSTFRGGAVSDRNATRSRTQSRHGDLKSKTIELLQQYHQSPSTTLRNGLVEMNLGLVRKEAHHWTRQCQESFDDLMQIGCIGLIQAIERFDISRGLAFSSFAMPYIRGEIQHYLRDKSNTVRIPRRWSTLVSRRNRLVSQLSQQLGRTPTATEVREAMELTVEEWQQFQSACNNRVALSLDAPVGASETGSSSLGELVPDAGYQSFQLAQEDRLRLQQAMVQLEEQTRQVLEFVFFEDLTQKDAAKRLGISSVTVSRKVSKGVKQLAQLLNASADSRS